MTAPEEIEPAKADVGPEAGVRMSLGAHIAELRYRLIVCVVAIVVAMAAVFPVVSVVIDWLQRPLNQPLYFLAPTEAFWAHLKVALFGGLILALPVVFFQLWRFIAPAMYRSERSYAILFVGASVGFFLVGVIFSHLVAFPFALRFLVDFGLARGLSPLFSIGIYLGFAVKFYLAFGLVFELPLGLTLASRIGIVTAATLARHRRHALIFNALAAAILTPTVDIFNMMLMLVPLTLLYEVGILGARLFGRSSPSSVEASV